MDYIEGNYRKKIYDNTNGYIVGLFKVKKSNLRELVNKTVTFTGYFTELNNEMIYLFNGKYIIHEKYGNQFQVSNYELVKPEGKDSVIEFLSSSFVKGCGESTAKKIVKTLGEDAIKLIKDDKNNLVKVGLSEKQTNMIYDSIITYYDSDELIIKLTKLGFTPKEITRLLSIYGKDIEEVLKNNLYSLIDIVEFSKLDKVFFNIYNENNQMRSLALIIETIKRVTFDQGDTYLYKDEIINNVKSFFNIDIDNGMFDELITLLKKNKEIKVINDKYFLRDTYLDELNNAKRFSQLVSDQLNSVNHFSKLINELEDSFHVTYNQEQKNAIKCCLENRMTIITGGPGTGKTTIINALVYMYQKINNFSDGAVSNHLALLAPTGRASKRMSEAALYPASTIHRYLKWNKDTASFGVNEHNKNLHNFIIIDEASMLDNALMSALFNGTKEYACFVLVGDDSQLPSVSPGNVLKDLIDLDIFPHIDLKTIYRQSDNSFIPILADEIKNKEIVSDISIKRDDYNFLKCRGEEVKPLLKQIISSSLNKNIDPKDIQVLAPMYRGINGIDNLNILLQEIINPKHDKHQEIRYGNIIYREGDKVINLVNNIDDNIYNGDIGYIVNINVSSKEHFMDIDFYGNIVKFKRDNLNQIRHAYAMSIHKSQGSEFMHVIIPIVNEYKRMLYNKLIYTGVSRAKKTLIMLGSMEAFNLAVNNNYSVLRKTYLKENIMNILGL